MEENLEYRINTFRKKMLGKDLSERYPTELSEDGNLIHHNRMSNSDFVKFFVKFFGKIMIPYSGDKSLIEYIKLESELKPENKKSFYFAGAASLVYKYVGLGALALHLVG